MSRQPRAPEDFRLEAQIPGPPAPAAWPVPLPGLRGQRARLLGVALNAELWEDWPRQLVTLVEAAEAAIRATLRAQPQASPQALAHAIVLAQADAHAGQRVKFTSARDEVLRVLRDAQIYRQFDGRNVVALARRYRLSKTQIYNIIARQRDLRRRKAAARRDGRG